MNIIFLFTLMISILHFVLSQNDCVPTRCTPSGPIIRFPFRLRNHQPDHCGYPGFELTCSQNNITKFDFQFPITATVNDIKLTFQTSVSVWDVDYMSQKLLASNAVAKSCLPDNILTTSQTTSNDSMFEVEPLGYNDGYTLFNCTDTRGYGEKINCLSRRDYEVIAFASMYEITSLPPYSSCFKMYNVSYVPDGAFNERGDEYGARFYVRWSKPSCGISCETEGKYCRLRNGGNNEEVECFSHEEAQHGGSRSSKPITAGIITAGTFTLLFITIASYFILRLMKRKKEGEKRIKMIIENHKDIKPRRYSYAEIKKITSNFKEKFGSMHKGKLLDDQTRVVVKLLNDFDRNLEDFISEVGIIGRMQHLNVLQLIGYCVDRHKRALVYELRLQRETVGNFTTSDNQSLDRIILDIAKGINYVHQECDEKFLNLDISPQNIFLDDNLNPKISVFPAVAADHLCSGFTYDIVSKKEDVFSLGMLMLAMSRRRIINVNGEESEESEDYLPEWIYDQLNRLEENEIVKRLLIVGLWCIQWFPSDRPSMKRVVQMLQGDNMPFLPPNPFAFS